MSGKRGIGVLSSRGRVAYLVSKYPSVSHAFIETEIEALRAEGFEVQAFSVHRPTPADLLAERSKEETRSSVNLLDRTVGWHLVAAFATLLWCAPSVPAAALSEAVALAGPGLRGRLRQVAYLGEALLLWRHMSRRGLRHVHVHFANNGADIARLTVRLGTLVDGEAAGWRWTLAMHGPTEFEDQEKFGLRGKFQSASAIACITWFCRSQVMRYSPPECWDKAGVVAMSVDPARFRPSDKVTERRDEPLRILTVGRLVPEKGSPLLVDAVARLNSSGVPCSLTVVGTGPLAEPLAQMVHDRGLEDIVHLVGAKGQHELPSYYQAADVFCLPSFAEGLPVVLMEAMSSGLPVISTRIAGIPELVVDGENGRLVTAGRVDELEAALAGLAADRDLLAQLGRNAEASVTAEHDPAVNARRLITLFERTERQAS